MISKNTIASIFLLGSQVSATHLYVSSYAGTVTSLNLSSAEDGYTLEILDSTDACGSAPSWITLSDGVLYCTDEGFATWPNGTIATFAPQADGTLELLDSVVTHFGAVSALLYGPEKNGLAIPYYAWSAFTTWDATDPANLELLSTQIYELEEPGAIPDRQGAPHPHQAIADPTGEYILIPDLGADSVRIYGIQGDDLSVTELEPLDVPPGSGPRHVAFAVHGEKTYFYVVNELSNTIIGYDVTYGEESLSFEQIYESGTHGEGVEVPEGAAAAEIVVSDNQEFLIVSSRNENIFEITNPDPTNSTDIVSDTLINFAIDPATGDLTTLQEVPAGGRFPRQFSLNADNTLLGVGLQFDGRVSVIERDPESGLLGDFVASALVGGDITAVVFNDEM